MNGGDLIAQVLVKHGVRFLFTLCGGHISPILVSAKRSGTRVVDVRHEATAVFAADAVARLTGIPGVAAVTAGPGVTNTVTAVKTAQLAQSPLILLGGAAATILKGRGALQDIKQLPLMRPHVKWVGQAARVRDLVPTLERAFLVAQRGVPGPVFVECPVDVLYDEKIVREWYRLGTPDPEARGFLMRLRNWYVGRHLNRLFTGAQHSVPEEPPTPEFPEGSKRSVQRVVAWLERAERPVMLVGSQAMLRQREVQKLAEAIGDLDVPVFLSGMARGLLPRQHPLLLRHARRQALRDADLVILAGVPLDFRLEYGNHINRKAVLVSVTRGGAEFRNNRRPTLDVDADPATYLVRLAVVAPAGRDKQSEWTERLRARDQERDGEIERLARVAGKYINPLLLCRAVDRLLEDDAILALDGGDFVGTASYIVSPRRPLSWIDPGVFGTLGAGAGFALGAKLCRPESEVWILYGDGSAAYSLAEFDTFVRHGLPVIAVVGNDACWTQIARGQREMLEDDVGTVLRHSDYHRVAEGYGGKGFRIQHPDAVEDVLRQAKAEARRGAPVLVNALIGTSEFRSGSISM
ncbi:MAG: thiamine pyrophosphate-binding protein [Gemmatimonadales bacterium]|nr:thiamine pyrophosphate-binding protein [Gemmatimonadales bacterium]NIN13217.1 thiamine pyrophosphate-binding protein [Gemmatimonadales bacterium]NIN51234.1 thiamine pyrophosphate-binding protein [Gemmatimonadales bacterium]NIP08698.1 thiamine pyrophosphate-binding protein [Gemmatimonadales bacterium]NIR00951.1 thiamine pyrophosphate-binding protein [Gemmatimonadales bacterium]